MNEDMIIANALSNWIKTLDRQMEKYRDNKIISEEIQKEINTAADLAAKYRNKALMKKGA